VAVRPEPFGALLYHFGTRKLSFLKNRTILAVVQSLADCPDVRAACRAAGVEDARQRPYLHALGVLADSNMLVPAGAKEAPLNPADDDAERSDKEEARHASATMQSEAAMQSEAMRRSGA
jgi:mycofactocin biosynthesis protein MftB